MSLDCAANPWYNHRMKTLTQIQNEMDHTNTLLDEAYRNGNLAQIEGLTDHMLDLHMELKSITHTHVPTDEEVTQAINER